MARSIALKAAPVDEAELTRQQIAFLRQHVALGAKQDQRLEREIQKLDGDIENNRTQNLRERLRIVFEVALAVVVLVIAGAIGHLLYSAWHAQNVVISAFDVPPSMETQGRTGKVLAADLLDELQKLQSETRASVAKRGVTDAWSGDVKLEIPEAHISIGDLQRYLRDWLGNETHISGSIVQAADNGLALTVRGTGFPAKTFSGKTDALPALMIQAAEYVYGSSETYRFGVYLQNHGRDEESIALVKAAYSSALESDKPLLLNVWGIALNSMGHDREALDKHREAVALKPDFWIGYNNIMFDEGQLQEEEGVVQAGLQMERLARRGHWHWSSKPTPELYFQNLDLQRWDLLTVHQVALLDMASSGGHGTTGSELAPSDAGSLALMHDWKAAELELQTSPGAGTDPYVIAQTDFVHGQIALERGEFAAALPLLQQVDAAVTKSTDLATNFTGAACWLALAQEWSGQHEQATAAIVRGGHLVDCYRFKADITDHHGDWALAQQQYADAVTLAPSIPSAYLSWGQALARHGDFDAAIAKFSDANARGPHWADPLKSWGDALAAKHDEKTALDRYAQAEQYAPNWGQLQLHWGLALQSLGRTAEAKQHLQKALDLDLIDSDRKIATAKIAQL